MEKHAGKLLATLALLLIHSLASFTALGQGTAFTYQGRLLAGGNPANGIFNLQFALYNNSAGAGSAVAGPVTTNGVLVTGGLFTVTVDFGPGPWNGQTNWLQVGVETNNADSFTNLAPLQELTPVPYAMYAPQAGSASTAQTAATAQYSQAAGVVTGSQSNLIAYADAGGDINASAFATAAGISATPAQNNLTWLVKHLKQLGCWTNCVEYILLDNSYNPSNHVPLAGNPWTCNGLSNELHSTWGQDFFLTNTLTVTNLPPLSNCTIAVTFREFPNDTVGNGADLGFSSMVHLMSPVDGSSLLSTIPGGYGGQLIFTSAGTNWYLNAPVINAQTNTCYYQLSGAYDYDTRIAVEFSTTVCISYNSNGLVSCWRNGLPGLFLYSSANQTNLLAETRAANPFTTLGIGGNTNWMAQQNNGIHTNYQGQILAIGVWNQSCEQNTNIPIAAWQAAMCAEPNVTELVEFAGSSRLNYEAPYLSVGIPVTNSMPLIFRNMQPNIAVIQDAYPGSQMSTWFPGSKQNMFTGIATNYAFVSPLIYAPREKFPGGLWFATDGPRNDCFATQSPQYCLQLVNKFCLPLATNGINIQLIETGVAGNEPVNENATLWSMWQCLETNFLFAKIASERSLTMDYLTNGGVALDGVHLGYTNSIRGYNASEQFARLTAFGTPYPPFFAAVSLPVSGSPWLHTNFWPYTVHDYISGGTVTGIGDNGSLLFITDPAQVVLAPGDVLSITNSAAPTVVEESTQF